MGWPRLEGGALRPVLGPHLKALVTDSELVDADFQELAARCPNLRKLQFVEPDAIVAESGRPGRAELLAKKGRIVGGVGCPPNCRTSGKPRGSSDLLELLEKCCILEKSRKNLFKFGENSVKFWQNLRNFGKNSKQFSNF